MPTVTIDEAGRIVWKDSEGKEWTYLQGDIAWMLAATALVWIMTPGVGFLYSGLLQRKNALSMVFLSVAIIAVVTLQWWFWGFSFAFSDSSSVFWGNFKYIGLKDVFENPGITHESAPHIPAIVYCVFQLTFACITPVLAIGAIAERGRIFPALIFVFIWSTLVYDPIACWTWNARGWANSYGQRVLDFAGGTVVHISSGCTSLAISIFLGKRPTYQKTVGYVPHDSTYIVLGTVLLWFGWFGFNGGSALGANIRAAQACFVTTLAASAGGITWMLFDCWADEHHRLSVVGFCSGVVSALVAITPGSGFVGAPASVLFGFLAGVACRYSALGMQILPWAIDDNLDIFSMHAVGGLLGNILTAFFAQKSVARADGETDIAGGFIDSHYKQLGWQLANSVAGIVWSLGMTTLILWGMHFAGLSLRRPAVEYDTYVREQKVPSLDELDLEELAYDYVYIDKDPEINLAPDGRRSGRETRRRRRERNQRRQQEQAEGLPMPQPLGGYPPENGIVVEPLGQQQQLHEQEPYQPYQPYQQQQQGVYPPPPQPPQPAPVVGGRRPRRAGGGWRNRLSIS